MSPAILFSYQRDGIEYRTGIQFSRLLAFRSRAERCCKSWPIEGAYDTLVELENSCWI